MDDNENIIPDLGPMTDLKTAIKRGAVTLLVPDQSQYNLSTPGRGAVPMKTDDKRSLSPPPLAPLSGTTRKKTFYLKSFDEQFADLHPQRTKSICSEAQPQRVIPKSSSVGSQTEFSVPNVMETEYPVAMSRALPAESGSIPKKRIPFKPIMLQHFATTEAEPEEILSTMPSTSSAEPRYLVGMLNRNNINNLMLKPTTFAPQIVEATIPRITPKMPTPLATNVGMQYPISTWTSKEHPFIHFTTTGADPPATTSSFKARPKPTSTVTSMSKYKMPTAYMEPPITTSYEKEMDIPQMPSEMAIYRKSRKQKFPLLPEEAPEFPKKPMAIDPIPSTASSSTAGAKRQSPYKSSLENPSKTTKTAQEPRAKIELIDPIPSTASSSTAGAKRQSPYKSSLENPSKTRKTAQVPDDDPIAPSMEFQTYPLSTSSGLSSEKRTKIKPKKKKSSVPTATVTLPPDDGNVSTNLGKDQPGSTSSKKSKEPKLQNRKVPKANKLPVTVPIITAQLPIVSTTVTSKITTTTTFTSYKLVKCSCITDMPAEPSVVTSSVKIVQTMTLPMAPIVEVAMAPIVEVAMAPIVEVPMVPIVVVPMAPIVQVPMAMPPSSVANSQSTIAPNPEEYSVHQPRHISMTTAPTLVSSTDTWGMSIPIMTEPPLILMATSPDTSPELEVELQQPTTEEPLGNTDARPRTDGNESMQSFLLMDSMFPSRSRNYILHEIRNSAIPSGNSGPENLGQSADIP